jgi:zinc transporter, ZIP family
MIPGYIIASLWGAIGSFALLIGGFFGYRYTISKKVTGVITAFSAGILIAAVCFELLFEATLYGNIYTTSIGFISGVAIFTILDTVINKFTIEKHKEDIIKLENDNKNNDKTNIDNNISDLNTVKHKYTHYFNKYQVKGVTALTGALLDGIPESIAIGLLYFIGGPISVALLSAVFISNLIEGTSASFNMKLGGWTRKEVLGIWTFVLILTAVSAMLSYIIFSHTDKHILSGALAVAAGSLLAMIADSLLPEAFNEMHQWTGFIMAVGFLITFILSRLAI